MSRDNRRTAERLDIARERIAAERTARTGRLDLGNLGLTRPPPGLAELDWLEALNLGGVYESYGTVLRRSDAGEWEETDEAYNPNHIESILSALTKLPHLRHLDCFGAELHDLTPLAGCSALESLDCEDTQVTDLAPLAGCSALQSLDCGWTQADLSALESLDCRHTQVTDLAPLAGCSALQSLDCSNTQVADLAPLAECSTLRKLNCWETRITNLPQTVIELPGLERLVIQAQPEFGHIPAEVLSQNEYDDCLSRLRAHLADLAAGGSPLRDLKVIVLGNGRIGKTQLCRRLRGEAFEPDADSTHGISVTSVPLTMPKGEKMRS